MRHVWNGTSGVYSAPMASETSAITFDASAKPAVPASGTAGREAARWMPLVVAAIPCLVFAGLWNDGWLNWDDTLHVTENPLLNPITAEGIARFWTQAYAGLYIPVAYMLFAAESVAARWLAGAAPDATPDPHLFRLVSIMLHATNAVLVAAVLKKLRIETSIAAAAGAILFAIHPLQVEAVAWISEQRGLLAAALALGALLCHLEPACEGVARVFRRTDVFAALLFVLALLSKPQVASWPLVALLLGGLGNGPPIAVRATRLVPWVLAAAVIVAVSRSLQTAEAVVGQHVLWWQRPVIAGDALAFYGTKLLLPFHLALDYGQTPGLVLASHTHWLVAACSWLALAGTTIALRHDVLRRAIWVGVLGLLPTLGFVPFDFQEWSTVADRYAYLAMLGPALAFGAGCQFLVRHRSWLWAVVPLVALTTCGWLSWRQSACWKDSFTVFQQCLRVNPNSFPASLNLGNSLVDEGRVDEAVGHLQHAVTLGDPHPDRHKAYAALANALHRQGRIEESADVYRDALRIAPERGDLHNDYGSLLASQGRFAEAAESFSRAIKLGFDHAEVRRNLEQARRLGEGR